MKKEEISLNTKRKISDALKNIMSRKSFEKITVKEILEEANVTRSTFYYHFEDIYDLIKWIVYTEILEPFENCKDALSWDESLLLLLKGIQRHRQLCLCGYKGIGHEELHRIFFRKTRSLIKKYIDTIPAGICTDPEHIEFITDFYTMGLVDSLIQWIQTTNPNSPEEMHKLLYITVKCGINASFIKP